MIFVGLSSDGLLYDTGSHPEVSSIHVKKGHVCSVLSSEVVLG